MLGLYVAGAWAQSDSSSSLPVLTQVGQIRQLTTDQAARGYPVRIRGTVTGDVPAPDFFVQDATAGIYVEGNTGIASPHRLGDLVEVEGITGPGKFAPVIREVRTQVVGKGTLPRGRLLSFAEVANGEQDSQWGQIRGMVRTAAIDRTSWRETTLAMTVAAEGGQFKVRVPITQDVDPSYWVDTQVAIEGVCGSLFNADRQLIGILFYVPRLRFIRLEKTAAAVPFSALLRYSPDDKIKQRVQVQGVVGYQQLGSTLFLQSQGKGLRVLTQQGTPVQVGDVVEVQGFPAVGESAPVMEDAVFRRIGHENPPAPMRFDVDAPWERYDGTVVTAAAKLLQRQPRPDGLKLVLQLEGNGLLFDATLPPGVPAEPLLAIPLNSELQVTGIWLVRAGGLWRVPESFRVLLRTPADVVVLQAASWWTLRRTLWVLGITAGILLGMTALVVILGRRVHAQMGIIRQKLRSGAVLEDRNRIARELHDTLEQELAGITMQLDLAADCFQKVPDVARRALEMARKMSRHSMGAARRSVWDLRCHLLENGDLVSALSQAVSPMAVPGVVDIEMQVKGTPQKLPGPMEMNLLRIGQEAVANAVKHAHARRILVDLEYRENDVGLCVSDDGRGFVLNDPAFMGNGHFGLVDMRERAQSMSCGLRIESTLGSGTRVELQVPLGKHRVTNDEHKTHTYSGRG
ncbi:MAG: hypothetical protein JST79_05170 [Acidobacteria bacterium]|nr:hypothetical protein [Acidobacteriota bacterium]